MSADSLRQATREYVEAAMKLVRSRCAPAPDQLDELPTWVRTGSDTFRLQPIARHWWYDCVRTSGHELHDLPEYHVLIRALEADHQIAPLLGQVVGTEESQARIEPHRVTDRLIWELGKKTGAGEFDLASFDDLYSAWDAELRSARIREVSIAPLVGLSVQHVPVQLEPGITIDALTDDEISRMLSSGFLPPDSFHSNYWWVTPSAKYGVRIERDAERRIAESTGSRTAERWRALTERCEDVLIALRILKAGQVRSPGFASFQDCWFLRGSTSFNPLPDFPFPFDRREPSYWLADEDLAEMPKLFARYRKAKKVGPLSVGTRRFAYAADRNRADDRIVDLMIAAEALFLPGTASELAYQLSLRAACFLDKSIGAGPVERLRYFKAAYDARSKVAHGHELKPKKLRALGGKDPVSIEEFSRDFERTMRVVIRKALKHAEDHGSFPSSPEDWDDLILRERIEFEER